jgi:CheY-like chemotaxis protein
VPQVVLTPTSGPASGLEIDHRDDPDDILEVDPRLILLVEDEPNLLEIASFVLESEGFTVETAKNGEEALARLRASKQPGLVLLDLVMPVMNGRELLDEIARSPSLRPPPIVVLTAGDSTTIPGAVEVLRKPYDLDLLLEVVERHTGGPRPTRES